MKLHTYDKSGKPTKQVETTTTYLPTWTMDTITKTVDTGDGLPGLDLPREVKPLPFFWWLNPWKHLELLFDAYVDTTEVCNAWREAYHRNENCWKQDSEERDDAIERLRDELETMRAERDAANDAVRFLRKKPRRK